MIFGAGASYDSLRTNRNFSDESRPPLANDLFQSRYDSFVQKHRPGGPLIAELRRLGATVALETELDRLQREEGPKSATRRRELLALRYYLRDLLWDIPESWRGKAPGQTNYHVLLQRLAIWREETGSSIGLVTFNYDTMLEQAVQDIFGLRLWTMDRYTSSEHVKVFKPHGSCDWVRVVANDVTVRDKGQSADEIEFHLQRIAAEEGLTLADDYHRIHDRGIAAINGRLVAPALTVPARAKDAFELPEDHLSALREFVHDVIYLLVIGWRASELNFLGFWREAEKYTQPRAFVVNGSPASGEATLAALGNAGIRTSEQEASEGGFSDFVDAPRELQRFLGARFPGLS